MKLFLSIMATLFSPNFGLVPVGDGDCRRDSVLKNAAAEQAYRNLSLLRGNQSNLIEDHIDGFICAQSHADFTFANNDVDDFDIAVETEEMELPTITSNHNLDSHFVTNLNSYDLITDDLQLPTLHSNNESLFARSTSTTIPSMGGATVGAK